MALDLILARQAGVISREQALRAGVSAATVDRMVRTRRWRPLHPRVYLVPGYGSGDEARARAAVLWAGEGAVLSGASAAWWHGLLADAPPTIGVTAPVQRSARAGVAVRGRLLDAADRAVHRGLPVTARGLTVLEAAAELGAPDGELLLDRVLRARNGWAEVVAAHRRNPTAAACTLLATATARSAAAAGAELVRLLQGSGLRGWHRPPARVDRLPTVMFPAARVAVEAVGRPGGAAARARTQTATQLHGDRDSREDAARPPRVGVWERASRGLGAGESGCACVPDPTQSAGLLLPPDWRVLRFDLAELTGRPSAVVAAIAAAVAGRDLHHLDARIGASTGKWR
jgi:hypothetical protein